MRLLIGEMQIYRAGKDHHGDRLAEFWLFLCFLLISISVCMGFESEPWSVHAPVGLVGGAVSLSSKPTEQGPPLTRKLSDFSVFRQK